MLPASMSSCLELNLVCEISHTGCPWWPKPSARERLSGCRILQWPVREPLSEQPRGVYTVRGGDRCGPCGGHDAGSPAYPCRGSGSSCSTSWALVRPETIRSSTSVGQAKGDPVELGGRHQ